MTSPNSFDAALADVQSEMVAACLEYSGGAVDEVFVHFTATPNSTTADTFFNQSGRITMIHKLVDVDTSMPRMQALLGVLMSEVKRLRAAAAEFDRPMPSEGRLHYDVAARRLDTDFNYGPLNLGPNEIAEHLVERWVTAEVAKLAPSERDLAVAASAGIGEQAALRLYADAIGALAGKELPAWKAAVGVSVRLDEDNNDMVHQVVCYDDSEGRYLFLEMYQPQYTALDEAACVVINEHPSQWGGMKTTVKRNGEFTVDYAEDLRWAWLNWTRGDAPRIPIEQLLEKLRPTAN